MLLSACGQAASQMPSAASGARPQGPKTLTIGLQRGLPQFGGFSGLSTATSATNIPHICHDGLTYNDYDRVHHPLLVVDLPSLDTGTWRVGGDGTMETTWQLKPNVKWHDGAPLTTADLAFSFTISKDKDLTTTRNTTALALMSAITAVDERTFIISWSGLNADAGTQAVSEILPRHLLAEVYEQRDPVGFVNHPFFTTQFVGLGPYRLVGWEPGADMEFERFDVV
jgi:ABC-type transport system substrate-binding protein